MLPRLNDLMRHNIHLQLVTVNSIFELTQSRRQSRLSDQLRGLAFSVYSQSQRPLRYQRDCKTLTGFGPASSAEQYLKKNNAKAEHVGHLYCPSYVLSPLPVKKKTASEVEEGGERSATVLFCNYFLSEDQVHFSFVFSRPIETLNLYLFSCSIGFWQLVVMIEVSF